MAELSRADELVRAMDADAGFLSAVQTAPTTEAKRTVLDAHGFQDVGLDDMRAYVEGHGGTFTLPQLGHELSDHELAAVAGGLTDEEKHAAMLGGAVGGVVIASAAVAAA